MKASKAVSGLVALWVLSGCATVPPPGQAVIQRLDPADLARIEASRPGRPLTVDEIVARSRDGRPTSVLLDEIKQTGTHFALTPSQAIELREKGVKPEVLDAITSAHALWERDQLTAEQVRRETENKAAIDRARAEAERRAARPPYWDPYPYPYSIYPRWSIGYGQFHGAPGRWRGGGWGWGVRVP